MKLLLYCTKSKPYLLKTTECLTDVCNKYFTSNNSLLKNCAYNGKIVAECDFEVEKIECRISIGMSGIHDEYTTKSLGENELLYASKIDEITFINYLKGKNGYAIHIENLHIFDEPMELNEVYKDNEALKYIEEVWENYGVPDIDEYDDVILKNAPQNMMYAYGITTGEKYILISINTEQLCRILNREQTIIVRKKVLKELI